MKNQKIFATFCLCLLADAIFTMGVEPPKYFTWIVFDQFVLVLKTQLTWLRENHWMSTLIIRDTVYLRKGNTYGTKYKLLIAMLSVYATFMILLDVLI